MEITLEMIERAARTLQATRKFPDWLIAKTVAAWTIAEALSVPVPDPDLYV